ADDPVYDAEGN
nr:W2 peptide [Psophocarpus tetragonolobus=winged-beans, PT4912, seeds, Peptide Partial, 11 aa] [Psophocarpus tetragonolobus]